MKKFVPINNSELISHNKYIISNPGVVLLAAGASTRLGKPKQLLDYKGESFLEHMIKVVEQTGLQQLVIVIGANAPLLTSLQAANYNDMVRNDDWPDGLSSSIRCGIGNLEKKYPDCDGVLLMVCDQPYITPGLLQELISTQKKSGKPMAACRYENTLGTPAIFHQSIFPELVSQKGDKGAGKIFQQRPGEVSAVEFPLGRYDIDTPGDYESFLQDIKP